MSAPLKGLPIKGEASSQIRESPLPIGKKGGPPEQMQFSPSENLPDVPPQTYEHIAGLVASHFALVESRVVAGGIHAGIVQEEEKARTFEDREALPLKKSIFRIVKEKLAGIALFLSSVRRGLGDRIQQVGRDLQR